MTRDVVRAVTFGRTMSDDVRAVHVTDDPERAAGLRSRFERQLPGIPLTIIDSPYRALVAPLVRYLAEAGRGTADGDVVIVLLPEYRARHSWQRFLFNDNAHRIEAALLRQPDVLVASVPYRRSA